MDQIEVTQKMRDSLVIFPKGSTCRDIRFKSRYGNEIMICEDLESQTVLIRNFNFEKQIDKQIELTIADFDFICELLGKK